MKVGREKLRAVLVRVAVGLGMGLVLLSPIPAGCHKQHHWSLMAIFAISLGAVALVVRGLDRHSRPRIDPALVALGGLALVILCQLIPLPAGLVGVVSPARFRLAQEVAEATGSAPLTWLPLTTCLKCTRDSLLLLVAYISVFYAASTLLAREKRWKLIFGAAVASAGVLSIYGFTQIFAEWGTRLTSTFINPNRFAALMAMSGACAVGMFVAARAGRPRKELIGEIGLPRGTIWLAAAVIIETALVLTLSRFGIASVLIAGLLTTAVFTGRRSVWAVLAGVLLVLALNSVVAADPVLARYSVLFERELGGNGRLQCWRMSLPLVVDFPVFGSGAGTFKHVFRLYQDPSLPGWYTFAHNDYLNLFCDVGLTGLAVAGTAIVFLTRRIVPLRSSKSLSDRGLAVAAFLGLSAVFLHSIADFPLQEPAVALFFIMLAGIAYGRARQKSACKEGGAAPGRLAVDGPRPAGPLARWSLPAHLSVALALCSATLPPLVRLCFSGRLAERASRIAVARHEQVDRAALLRRVELLERAAELDEWDAQARYEAARTRIRLIAEGTFKGNPHSAIRAARHEINEGLSVSSLDPRPYYLDAVLTWRLNATERPDRMMLFALKMAPAWDDVAYQVGRYFLMRWRHARRAEPLVYGSAGIRPCAGKTLGLVRWQNSHGECDELFKRMAESLSFAARSPRARDATARLVVAHGLSPKEIDAALWPDTGGNLALASCLAGAGEHARASARYEKALSSAAFVRSLAFRAESTGPSLCRIHVSYARSLLETGRREVALEQFDEALRASPAEELAGTIHALGSLPAAPQDTSAVADYWGAARELMPEEPAVLLALARAELAAGRDESGFDHLLEYANATRDAASFAKLAHLAQSRRELGLAASLAAEAARCDPRNASHRILLAGLLQGLGHNEGAASEFEKALLLSPESLAAARGLSAARVKAGQYPQAISVWRRFVDAGGDAAIGHEAAADIYLRLLDRARAKEELEKALEARPNDERLQEKLDGIRL